MSFPTPLEYCTYISLALGVGWYIRHRLRLGRLIQYNMDMGPPDPDAIEYEQGFVCIYYGNNQGGGSTVQPSRKLEAFWSY